MKLELECTRHNVTPSQFLSYVRSQIKRHGMEESAGCVNLDDFQTGDGWDFDNHYTADESPCKHEKSISHPYEHQTLVENWDGYFYNEIAQFEFDDEKTGFGYYYVVAVVPTDPAAAPESAPETAPAPAECNDPTDPAAAPESAPETAPARRGGRKLTTHAFGLILAATGAAVIDDARVVYNGTTPGTIYTLDRDLTADQVQRIRGYNNTVVTSAAYRYAPEIIHTAVFIGDRPLTR